MFKHFKLFAKWAQSGSLGSALRAQALYSAGRLGLSKGLGAALLKLGASRVAIGAATAGGFALSAKQAHEKYHGLEREVLAEGSELRWLNSMIKPIWQHLEQGLQHFIVEELEPELQRRVPVIGRYLRFDKLTLGGKVPQLGPVTVTRTSTGVELNVCIDFDCEGTVDFSAGVTSIVVTNLKIKGAFQIALGPLVDALNPVGGITISCLDRPEIDLTIKTGAAIPNLYTFVRDAVDDVVARAVVVPRGIAVPISTAGGPVTDFTALRSPTPRGLLRLTLRDTAAAGSGPSQPAYATAQLGAATWTSPVARAGGGRGQAAATAVWEDGVVQDFLVYSPNQCVTLRLFQSQVGVDQFIGHIRMPVQSIADGGETEVDLLTAEGRASGRRIRFRGEWLAACDTAPSSADIQEAAVRLVGEKPSVHKAVEEASVLAGSAATAVRSKTKSLARSVGAHPAGDGFAEALVSARVDQVTGLSPRAGHRYFIRAIAAAPAGPGRRAVEGSVEDSQEGEAPRLDGDGVSDEACLRIARQLVGKLAAPEWAGILGFPVEFAEEFAEYQEEGRSAAALASAAAAAAAPAAPDDWELLWLQRARDEARSIARSCRPQFQNVFHLPTRAISWIELQLIRRTAGSSSEEVVASLEQDVTWLALAGGVVEGPFQLDLKDGGRCQLHGSVRVRHLLLESAPEVGASAACDSDTFSNPLHS